MRFGAGALAELAADPEVEALRSRVYGLESAVVEKAVRLMDKLSRANLHPYIMVDEQLNLTTNDVTNLDIENFRNDQDGPLVLTKLAAYTAASLTGAASPGAIFSNVSIQITDVEGHNILHRDPVLLPVAFSFESNRHIFDRPYVMDRRAALLVQATEENVNGTTDLIFAVHSEAVIGELDAREVEQAIALGVYPLSGRQSSVWDTTLLFGSLFGSRPPRLKGEAADLLDALRARVAYLRAVLRECEYSTYSMEASTANLTQNLTTALSRESFRNDQDGIFTLHRSRVFTVTGGAAAAAAVAALDNLSFSFASVDERIDITQNPVRSPVLYGINDNTWWLDHPHVVGKRGSVQVSVLENNANGTTDTWVSLIGEIVRGVTADEMRAAICLGLYPFMHRGRV